MTVNLFMLQRFWRTGLVVAVAVISLCAKQALALDPTLTIVSPSPGEVVASSTVNAIIDTDVALAETKDASGYVVLLWLDASPDDVSHALKTVQRGYIFNEIPAGLHTLHAAIADQSASGAITKVSESSVDFEVAPPVLVPVVGHVSWYSLLLDGLIFSFPIVALALLFLWMHFIIYRKR